MQFESRTEVLFREMSAALVSEMQHIAQRLQTSFSEELRREMDSLRENVAKDRRAAQFFPTHSSVSKAASELPERSKSKGSKGMKMGQVKSMHFAPHAWATRHIRRYRQTEDEDEEEDDEPEGEGLMMPSWPSRPSTASRVREKRAVSFAVSRATSESDDPVLLGKEAKVQPEPSATSAHNNSGKQSTETGEMPDIQEDENELSLSLPGQLAPAASRDSQPSLEDGSATLNGPLRDKKQQPKTKAVSVRPADRRRGGCEGLEMAMGLRQWSDNHRGDNKLLAWKARRFAHRLVRSQRFEYLVVAVIIANTIQVGAQINWMTMTGSADPSSGFRVMDIVICSFFAIEVGLRLFAHGIKFFYMMGWGWNALDFFLVVAQMLEELLIVASNGDYGGMDFAVLRIVRTLRCVRLIRVLRLTRFFDDLRRLVACMVYSAKSFIWSVMFVFLLVYIYGLYLTQSVHLHRLERGKSAVGDEVLAEYFGTVSKSILSLFQALTGGIDWRDLVEALTEYMNWGWGLATVFWIAFLMLGVMNIITGNFVSAAMERSQSVKDVDNVFQARRLFKSLDIDDSGAITIDEIRRHLESKPVQQFFRTIDVDSSEAEVLFEILDLSGDGSIDKEEFISGCLRLQGAARAVDLLLMTKDTRRGFEQIFGYLEEIVSRFELSQENWDRRSQSQHSHSDNSITGLS
ncbi:unnamed protein product [Effrenium voratum]|nr:unnamed protein product [Effrenium voratum]